MPHEAATDDEARIPQPMARQAVRQAARVWRLSLSEAPADRLRAFFVEIWMTGLALTGVGLVWQQLVQRLQPR